MRFELKLVDIQLKNFRLFEEVKVNFDDKLTVLIGENGAGKTALLEGVAKALNVFTEKMKTALTNVDFKSVYSDSDIRYRQREMATEIEVKFLEIEKLLPEEGSVDYFNEKRLSSNSEEDIKKQIDQIDAQLEILNERFRNEPDEEKAIELNDEMGQLLNMKSALLENNNDIQADTETNEDTSGWQKIQWKINQTKTNTQINKFSELKELDRLANNVHEANRREETLNLPVVVYYPSVRLSENDTNGQEHDEVFNTYDDALNGHSINFKWLLDWFVFKEDNIATSERLLNAVKKAIFLVLNDEETIFKEIKTDRTRKKDYRLVVQKGNDKVEVNQLSSGEKSLLVLVSDLARRLALANPHCKDPLEEGQGIVLIDEIDLHLHPRWQREVVPKLLEIFPKIQWVVTTHSPFIIAAEHVTPENAFLITEDAETKKKIVISVQDLGKQTEGLEPNRILKEIMNVSLRNKETERDIQKLNGLLNLDDFDKPETQTLFKHLSEQLGKQDSFIVRAAHRLSVLERQKIVSV